MLLINNAGVILGTSEKYDATGNDLGTRVCWNPGSTEPTEMGSLGLDFGSGTIRKPNAMNNLGYSVGFDYDAGAIAWMPDGTPIDLNGLIDPTSGWVLEQAYGINDSGWISGDGLFDPDGPGGQKAYNPRFSWYRFPYLNPRLRFSSP